MTNLYLDENCIQKINYLKNLIDELNKNEEYTLPVFLVKTQLIDFLLKYLLTNYPYKKDCNSDKLTMGKKIKEIEKIKDSYFDEIVKKSSDFKEFRNEIIHNFVELNMSIEDINKKIKENMKKIDDVEKEIEHYFWFLYNFVLNLK